MIGNLFGSSLLRKIILQNLLPHGNLRPVQAEALEKGLLTTRRNLIVSAPTNSGKTLVGHLALLEAIRQGKRGILLEPLRALAQEKFEELDALAPKLSQALGRDFTVRIATGDYRLEDEFLSDPPPGGELLIATPERLEALLRRVENLPWLESVGCVVVDEAHLIRNPKRGPNLEFLLTSLLDLPVPPKLVLLSATLGITDEALAWLEPCDVVSVTERHPPLNIEVLPLQENELLDSLVTEWCIRILKDVDTQILVFVYQTQSANKIAKALSQSLATLAGPRGALPYHSKMSRAEKASVRQAFISGESRVVVASSALGMGINLPTTHVLVRDLTFPGVGKLEIDELRQMLGRAGRGERPGLGTVLLRSRDGWNATELKHSLETAPLAPFQSALKTMEDTAEVTTTTARLVASLLFRRGPMTQVDLESFLDKSLGGKALAGHTPSALYWLEKHKLAFKNEIHYDLTSLGKRATRSVLPLEVAAGYAQLIRDLLTLDSEDTILASWKPLDHLLVLELLRDQTASLRVFSKAMIAKVDSWLESHSSEIPILYKHWIRKGESESILGSLNISNTDTNKKNSWANKEGYSALFRAIVLYSRSEGLTKESATREFSLSNLEGQEEKWRDNTLWLLAGCADLFETKVFYYHLRETCSADDMRIKRVESLLRQMKQSIYTLLHDLKYCSPLGTLLRQMRRRNVKVGPATIQKLEDAGIDSKTSLFRLSEEDLIDLGIRRNLARQIRAFARKTNAA